MTLFRCKMCGGTLEVFEGSSTAVCEYCGSQQTLPKLNDERIVRLYDRANHFRMNNEFDKAMGIYEQILDEDSTDAEAYWSLVLCRYGVEYVNDPLTRKRVPTVNRTQIVPILADPDYEMALKYADLSQKLIYEAEAKAINEIQEGIFAFSRQEDPFDVFISYKETDDNTGLRTQDSLDALEIFYLPLIKKGYNVFYAPMTLKEKHIPQGKYDSYIFSALSSAKVMIVLGSKKEYFESEWVKNEWGRYLDRILKNGEKKDIIPVYRDMSPDQLPDKLRSFEAFDLTKPDTLFYIMQKIEYNIPRAVTPKHTYPGPAKQDVGTVSTEKPVSGNIEALLKRVSIFLENGDWSNADIYCEKVLDNDPENGQAYVYKLMAQAKVSELDALKASQVSLDSLPTYKNAVRYADAATSGRLIQYNQDIKQNLERLRLEREAQIAREREIAELKAEQKRVGDVLTAAVNKKKWIEGQMAQKQEYINNPTDVKKLRRLARTVLVMLILLVALVTMMGVVAIAANNSDDAAAVVGLLTLPLCAAWVLYFVFGAKMSKANHKSPHLTWLNFPTYFAYSTICAIIILKKIKKGTLIASEVANLDSLKTQLESVDDEIEKFRNQLSEIYSKLCELEK